MLRNRLRREKELFRVSFEMRLALARECQRRNEAWPDHAMTKQTSQPTDIVRIGLVPAPVLHVRCIRQDHADMGLNQVEDRLQ